MSINRPVNLPSDDDSWGGCSNSSGSEAPSGPEPLAEFDDDSAYPTIEALQDAVNAFAKDVGCALAGHRGKKTKGTDIYKKYTFYYTRGGALRESTATLRNTTTIKTSCKYEYIARHTDEGWRWEQHT